MTSEYEKEQIKKETLEKISKEKETKYDLIGDFVDNLAIIGIGSYDFWGDCSTGFFGRWGCIDTTGKEIIPVGKYKLIGSEQWTKHPYMAKFSDDFLAVCDWKTGKWGFVDRNGIEIIPCIYYAVDKFSKGLVNVMHNKKWGYIDKTGEEIIPFKYDYTEPFSDNLARVMIKINENKKFGFIDINGIEVIPIKYDIVRDFSEGLTSVCYNGKWGFLDEIGNEAIPINYDFVRPFSAGRAEVQIIDPETKRMLSFYYIDKNGNKIQ